MFRQVFQTDFRRFSKQMDIILPDKAAQLFLNGLKRLGKISVGARNLYRDEQLDIAGAGEKVRQLIEEHVYSQGLIPRFYRLTCSILITSSNSINTSLTGQRHLK